MKKGLTSIIILNWNGKEDTKECLLSLSNSKNKNFEVILVDNGSTDDSVVELNDFIKTKKIDYFVKFVKNDRNLGFTGGNIEGLKKAEGEYIILLNNDTVVDTDWLGELIKTAESDRKIGVVGGKTYAWNENNPVSNKKNDSFAYQKIDPYLGYAHTQTNIDETISADSISGCAVLIKREVINKTGFLDPLFFAYYEETDLFARAIRVGYKIIYNPKALIWHRIAKSSGHMSRFYLYQMARNRAIFAIRNFDEPYFAYFENDYFRKGRRAITTYGYTIIRNIKGDIAIERKANAKAFLWVVRRWLELKKQREKIIKTGAYNKKLIFENDESVSIVIPNYNYASYIEAAIKSALGQSVKPLEIIVIDDGSTDNSVKIIKKYPVTLIKQKNQGVILAKNNGFKESHGRFVLFLDADDILEKNAIGEYLKAYRKDKSANFFYSDMTYFGAEKGRYRAKNFSIKELRKGNYIHNSSLIKREAFEAVGGYHESMSQGYEDWNLYISFAEQGFTGKYVSKSLLLYRRHDGTLSRNIIEQGEAVQLHFDVYKHHKYIFPSWYRMWKWFYFKTYYGTGTANTLLRVVSFVFRLFYKLITLFKLIILGRWKEAGKKMRGEFSFWKRLATKKE